MNAQTRVTEILQTLDRLDGTIDRLKAERDAAVRAADELRNFVEHTLNEYGERMPSQWKAHARAVLASLSATTNEDTVSAGRTQT